MFPRPNITFVLDVSPIIGVTRIQNMRKDMLNTFESIEYLNKVRQVFLVKEVYG